MKTFRDAAFLILFLVPNLVKSQYNIRVLKFGNPCRLILQIVNHYLFSKLHTKSFYWNLKLIQICLHMFTYVKLHCNINSTNKTRMDTKWCLNCSEHGFIQSWLISPTFPPHFLSFAPFGNLDLNPAYEYLKILDVTETFLLETGKYHFKLVNHLLPTVIGNYFDTSATQAARHTYSLRSLSSNRPPRFISKSKIGEKSIQYKGSQIWNAMPSKLKKCELFSQFKTSYKNYLLETEIDSSIFLNQTELLLSSWLVPAIQHTFLSFSIDLLVSSCLEFANPYFLSYHGFLNLHKYWIRCISPRIYLYLSLISDLVALPRGACFVFDTEYSCDPLILSKQSLSCECFSSFLFLPIMYIFLSSLVNLTVCLHFF